LLAGRLNVTGAVSLINQGMLTMSETLAAPTPNQLKAEAAPAAAPENAGAVQPSACGCQGAAGAPQLVYALGQIAYDLVGGARRLPRRRRWRARAVAGPSRVPERTGRGFPPARGATAADAAAVEWPLKLDGTPIYAVRPRGAFAAETYRELRGFLGDQLDGNI